MKKKLMALAALATCVTIGGVYAGWLYAEDPVSGAHANVGFGMTGIVENDESMGKLTATDTNIVLEVDDAANDNLVHTTTLKWGATDYFTVTFTTHTNAQETVKENGIPLQWYLGLATSAGTPVEGEIVVNEEQGIGVEDLATAVVYDNQAIFSVFDTTPVDITVGDMVGDPVTNGDGSVTFTYKIMLYDVIYKDYDEEKGTGTTKRIDVSKIQLPTRTDYSNYSTIIKALELHFHVVASTAQQG